MRRSALALAVLLVLALPATADTPDPETPELPEQELYFVCGDEPVQNVGDAEQRYATWSEQAPAQSVTEGAGCGTVDSPLTNATFGNPYDASWQGFITGELDSLTLDLHNIYVGPARMDGDFTLAVRVTAGKNLFPDELGVFLSVPAERSETGLSERIRFTITDIGLVGEAHETRSHFVQIVLHGGERQHEGPTITDTVSGWVWGTTEVPSGLVVNPAEPAETQVATGTSN